MTLDESTLAKKTLKGIVEKGIGLEHIIKDIVKTERERRIAIILDYDLTLTEEFQQMPYLTENLERIKEAYDGRKVINKNNGKEQEIRIRKPEDYFKMLDTWGKPHNGLGYVQQMMFDANRGVLEGFNAENLREWGSQVKLSPGLPEFFDRTREKWKDKDCDVRFYIVSVGIAQMIEGSEIVQGGHVDGLYATTLFNLAEHYGFKDNNGQYDVMQSNVSPFTKTQCIIEIAKAGDHMALIGSDEYLYEYTRLLILGDGTSDTSFAAYGSKKGGWVNCLYEWGNRNAFNKAFNTGFVKERANGLFQRDFSERSMLSAEIDFAIQNILDQKCNYLSPETLDRYRKKRLTTAEMDFVYDHARECKECWPKATRDIRIELPSPSKYANP